MQKVIDSERIPIKLWLDDIEAGALAQARDVANLPFAYKWVAVMADAHQGYGMPIGGVLAARGAVVPNAVGVDIGCGMCAAKTNLEEIDRDKLKSIMGKIRDAIPVGFKHHDGPQDWPGFDRAPDINIVRQELDSARHQLGTLGGGNHFIEIQKGSDGYVWVMIHSGSRNFGLKIANEYHKKAQRLCDRWHSELPNSDLAFLPIDTDDGREYLQAMNYALDFAKASRCQMMERAISAMEDTVGHHAFQYHIDVHHNYAAMENHFGENVMVHRKGAISAGIGLGIIPGSQGTKSYIVTGKGNPDSFMSCSHGAGRRMGRKQAQRELNLDEEVKRLDDQGIIHAIRNEKDLDEAAGAYKDIEVVMKNQADLVDIVVELSPLAVIKA